MSVSLSEARPGTFSLCSTFFSQWLYNRLIVGQNQFASSKRRGYGLMKKINRSTIRYSTAVVFAMSFLAVATACGGASVHEPSVLVPAPGSNNGVSPQLAVAVTPAGVDARQAPG